MQCVVRQVRGRASCRSVARVIRRGTGWAQFSVRTSRAVVARFGVGRRVPGRAREGRGLVGRMRAPWWLRCKILGHADGKIPGLLYGLSSRATIARTCFHRRRRRRARFVSTCAADAQDSRTTSSKTVVACAGGPGRRSLSLYFSLSFSLSLSHTISLRYIVLLSLLLIFNSANGFLRVGNSAEERTIDCSHLI